MIFSKQFFHPFLIVSALAFGSFMHGNYLQRVFHHRGSSSKTSPVMELGSVVMYFDQEPMVQKIYRSGQNHDLQFFFPGVTIDKTAHDMIRRSNQESDAGYQASVEPVSGPQSGVRLQVKLDPANVMLTYDRFVSISRKPGVIFRFFNKKLLDRIVEKREPVLRTASALDQSHVVIDFGHGGIDSGAIGCGGVREKDITLSVGLQVADLLCKSGCRVSLTRDSDATVALDQRTTFTNCCDGVDLFISIHANACGNSNASGIETFCVSQSLFSPIDSQGSLLHNKVAHHCLGFDKASQVLAENIHNNVIDSVKKKDFNVVDRRVKHAVSQVLLGVSVPATLIEVGFLTNEYEAKQLQNPLYQRTLAYGISKGILGYLQKKTKNS